MRLFLFSLVLFFTVFAYSQDQQGYFINNAGQRITGYFKPGDFHNPDALEFRDTETGNYKLLSPSEMKEYGIGEEFKFEKHTLKVDLSQSSSTRNYSNNKEPLWEERTLFLNVIVAGDASLYSSLINGETRFFYSLQSKNIKPVQLVKKTYKQGTQILENNAYKQELFVNLKCPDDNVDSFSGINYNKGQLTDVVKKYNECTSNSQKIYTNKGSSEYKTQLTVFAGANMSILTAKSASDKDTEMKPGFNLGIEGALVFPSGKWAVYGRLEMRNVKSEVQEDLAHTYQTIRTTYELNNLFLSFFVGPRYYLSQNFYADAGVGVNLGFGDMKMKDYGITPLAISEARILKNQTLAMNICGSLGLGYQISNKFGAELRYNTPSEVLASDLSTDVKLSNLSLNLRYTLN